MGLMNTINLVDGIDEVLESLFLDSDEVEYKKHKKLYEDYNIPIPEFILNKRALNKLRK